ncbi:MAG: ferritin family protein [Pseudomonadota bacterium]
MFVFGTADDVFAMAVRIEENGKAFYDGAAAKTDNPKVKKLFEDLAGMEAGHIVLFKAFRSTVASSLPAESVWDPEGLAESYLQATADTHIFTKQSADEHLKGMATPIQALEMALMFEKDSVVFFLGMKDLLPDPAGKGEIDKLIQSEQDHVRMISKALRDVASKGVASIPRAE